MPTSPSTTTNAKCFNCNNLLTLPPLLTFPKCNHTLCNLCLSAYLLSTYPLQTSQPTITIPCICKAHPTITLTLSLTTLHQSLTSTPQSFTLQNKLNTKCPQHFKTTSTYCLTCFAFLCEECILHHNNTTHKLLSHAKYTNKLRKKQTFLQYKDYNTFKRDILSNHLTINNEYQSHVNTIFTEIDSIISSLQHIKTNITTMYKHHKTIFDIIHITYKAFYTCIQSSTPNITQYPFINLFTSEFSSFKFNISNNNEYTTLSFLLNNYTKYSKQSPPVHIERINPFDITYTLKNYKYKYTFNKKYTLLESEDKFNMLSNRIHITTMHELQNGDIAVALYNHTNNKEQLNIYSNHYHFFKLKDTQHGDTNQTISHIVECEKRYLLTSSHNSNKLKLWLLNDDNVELGLDIKHTSYIKSFDVHSAPVTYITNTALHANSLNTIYTCSDNGDIAVIDITTCKQVSLRKAHQSTITHMLILTEPFTINTVATCSYDNYIKIWNTLNCNCKEECKVFKLFAKFNKVIQLAKSDKRVIMSIDKGGEITLWDVYNKANIANYKVSNSDIVDCVLIKNEILCFVNSGSNTVYFCSVNCDLNISHTYKIIPQQQHKGIVNKMLMYLNDKRILLMRDVDERLMQVNAHAYNKIYKKRSYTNSINILFNDIKSSIIIPHSSSTICDNVYAEILNILNHFINFSIQFHILSRKNQKTETLLTRTKTIIVNDMNTLLNTIFTSINTNSCCCNCNMQFQITNECAFTLHTPHKQHNTPINIEYSELSNENIIEKIKAKITNSFKIKTQQHYRSASYHYSTDEPLTNKRKRKRGGKYKKGLSFSMSNDKDDYNSANSNLTFVAFDDGKIHQTLMNSGLTIISNGVRGPKPSTYANYLVNKGRNIIEDYCKKTGRKRSCSSK